MAHRALLMRLIGRCIALVLTASAATATPSAEAGAAHATAIHLGVQPNTVSQAIGALMVRDRLLEQDLRTQGLRLVARPYADGKVMLQDLQRGQLALAFMGNLPVLRAAFTQPIVVAGLSARYHSVLVVGERIEFSNLRGKTVAYPAGTSSHLGLLRALEAGQLKWSDIRPQATPLADLSAAFNSGQVDAMATWEPRLSAPIQRSHRTLFRAVETNWIVLPEAFVQAQPAASMALSASYVRALNWMRQANEHAEQAVRWSQEDQQAYTGRAPELPREKALELLRRVVLDVPDIPGLAQRFNGHTPLLRELNFLMDLGELPAAQALTEAERHARLRRAFNHALLPHVLAEPQHYRLHRFRYEAPAGQ